MKTLAPISTVVLSLWLASCASGPRVEAPLAPAAPSGGPVPIPQRVERYATDDGELRREPRQRPHPRMTVLGSFGPGRFGQFVENGGLDDDTRGFMGRGRIEVVPNVVGGGLQIEGIGVDDDLFEDTGNAADVGLFEFYPHLTVRARAGSRFRMPMRLGPALSFIGQEFDTGEEFYYSTLSLMFEIEPEVDLVQTPDFTLSAFGAFRGGPGSAWISAEDTGNDEDYDTDVLSYGLEAGLRFGFGGFLAGFSYVNRNWDFDQSDVERGTFIRETDFDFHGVLFTFGGRW